MSNHSGHVSADQARNLKLTYRKGQGRAISIVCRDTNGDPLMLEDFLDSGTSFRARVIQTYDRDEVLLTLEEDSAGRISRPNGYTIKLDPTDDDVNLDEGNYEWEFGTIDPNNTWFNAPFIINRNPPDADLSDSASVTVNLGDNVVTLTINLIGGGSGEGVEHWRGFVDLDDDPDNPPRQLFPEEGGSGDARPDGITRFLPGDFCINNSAVILLDHNEAALEVPARSTLYYVGTINGDMQLGANWKINQG